MKHRLQSVCWLLLCLLSLTGISAASQQKTQAQETQASYQQYLPIMFSGLPGEPVFGLEVTSLSAARGLDNLVSLQPQWIRRNGLAWRDVEAVEDGAYRWDTPGILALEEDMIQASRNNMRLILVVRGSPRWATTPYQADCAPISPDKYAKFARFLAAAVKRYSQPPYNVLYWEIGNEPDAYLFPNDSVFGCWGLQDDPYYGGREYGEMLKAVAPAIRAANPAVRILNGGLLLDRPYDSATNAGLSARFVEGIFVAGAGSAFDILSYHGYSVYDGTPDGNVGAVDWKIAYLRQVMAAHNAQKPLFNTETALLCPTISTECRDAQASAVVRLYTRAVKNRLMGLIWYNFDSDSFRSTGLIEPNNVTLTRPAYHAYQHTVSLLRNAAYFGTLVGLPAGAEGYSFRSSTAHITVVWSNQASAVSIGVPSNVVVTCTTRDGQPLACQNRNGRVDLVAASSPIFLRYPTQ